MSRSWPAIVGSSSARCTSRDPGQKTVDVLRVASHDPYAAPVGGLLSTASSATCACTSSAARPPPAMATTGGGSSASQSPQAVAEVREIEQTSADLDDSHLCLTVRLVRQYGQGVRRGHLRELLAQTLAE